MVHAYKDNADETSALPGAMQMRTRRPRSQGLKANADETSALPGAKANADETSALTGGTLRRSAQYACCSREKLEHF